MSREKDVMHRDKHRQIKITFPHQPCQKLCFLVSVKYWGETAWFIGKAAVGFTLILVMFLTKAGVVRKPAKCDPDESLCTQLCCEK